MTPRLRIYEALEKAGDPAYHMPGHKARGEFLRLFPGAGRDVTELPFSDNLASPSGCIAGAERDIAELLGADRSYITTDGSSSGVHALVYAASRRGGKIVMPRASHASAYNACLMLGVEPVTVEGDVRDGMPLPPEPVEIDRALGESNARAVLVTSPDYYGRCARLEEIREICGRRGALLLCDGAHGAHLRFAAKELYCGAYADAWVDGAHKTLACLTQGAVVSARGPVAEDVGEGLALFRTTSPSYPVMASVEYAVKRCASDTGRAEGLFHTVAGFRAAAGKEGFRFLRADDALKLVLDCGASGLDARALERFLCDRGMYPEACDGRRILFYLSAETDEGDLPRLLSALREGGPLCPAEKFTEERKAPRRVRAVPWLDAVRSDAEYVAPERAAGRTAAANAGTVPPCTPLVLAGETVTEEDAEALSGAAGVFGTREGKIKVIR